MVPDCLLEIRRPGTRCLPISKLGLSLAMPLKMLRPLLVPEIFQIFTTQIEI